MLELNIVPVLAAAGWPKPGLLYSVFLIKAFPCAVGGLEAEISELVSGAVGAARWSEALVCGGFATCHS